MTTKAQAQHTPGLTMAPLIPILIAKLEVAAAHTSDPFIRAALLADAAGYRRAIARAEGR